MNLNKCERCGCFFVSANSVCPQCISKDENDINQLKTFLTESDNSVNIQSLACGTGISLKNVNRFLQNKELYTTFTSLGLDASEEGNNVSCHL
ncbi:MAG: hypothetical protein ACI4VQ_01695 [Clostridia bacterium]